MKTLIAVLGWFSVVGSVLGGIGYALTHNAVFGLLYLAIGLIASMPFFGLATALRVIEEQGEMIIGLRDDLNALQKSQRSEKAPMSFVAPVSDGKAPITSGARKLEQPDAPKAEAPKIDLSGIKESDNR